jgi:hypothetical protein
MTDWHAAGNRMHPARGSRTPGKQPCRHPHFAWKGYVSGPRGCSSQKAGFLHTLSSFITYALAGKRR